MDRTRETDSGAVIIKVDQRAFYGLVAILGVLAVFLVGLWVGKGGLSPAGRGQAALAQPAVGQQAIPMQPGAQQVPPWQQQQGQPPVTQASWPVEAHEPDGDHPHVALPELEAINYTYDFGDIAPDQIVEKTFKITNPGTTELVIEDVSSSCGCTAALVSANRIPPGGEGELRVTYDPRVNKDVGFITRKVRIKSNDPDAPLVEFTVAANVVAK
ncbi:MAG: DUF1573 domain-containing protein [Anaerolineae bacterium]